jgi:hypothetical protein
LARFTTSSSIRRDGARDKDEGLRPTTSRCVGPLRAAELGFDA